MTPQIDSYTLTVSCSEGEVLEEGLRFTGKETDRGTGLVYFGARYYDPEVGRWTTVDPAQHGLNWYAYCSDNPLKFIDPNGCKTLWQQTLSGIPSKKGDLLNPIVVFIMNLFGAYVTKDVPWSIQGVISGINAVSKNGRDIDLLPGDVITSRGNIYSLSSQDKAENKNIPKEAVFMIEVNTNIELHGGGWTGNIQTSTYSIYIARDSEGNYYDVNNPGESLGITVRQVMDYFDYLFLQGDYYDLHEGFNSIPENTAPEEDPTYW